MSSERSGGSIGKSQIKKRERRRRRRINHKMKFLRLTWMPKTAHFLPEENILNTALGMVVP